MARAKKITPSYTAAGDDVYLFAVTRDLSGGQNNRMHPSVLPENQADGLTNVDIGVSGQRTRRAGITEIDDVGATKITGLFGYDPQGYSANLLATDENTLYRWNGVGNFEKVYGGGNDSYTKLLLHMDGSDDGTTFTDSSSSGRTVTRVNAVTKTGVKKFGTASGYFDGSGDYLSVPNHADFQFGSGDFTIDAWAYFTDVTTVTVRTIFSLWTGSGDQRGYNLSWHQTTTSLAFQYTTDGTAGTNGAKIVSWTPTINTWYHIEVCRSGDNLYFFVDGAQVGTTQDLTGVTLFASSADAFVGAINNATPVPANFFIGYLDEVRVSKGIARHTGGSAGTTYFVPQPNAYMDDLSLESVKMIKAYKTPTGDITLISDGSNNVLEMSPTYAITDLGDTNTSPPKTKAMVSYRNRVWALKADLAYFSDSAPSDWSSAFDRTSNAFRVPVGEERAILATRDTGLIFFGKEQVWGLNPSMTPVATDKPEKLLDYGCAAGDTACQVGDDYYFLSFDGVRAVRRTIQDKLQVGDSKPLSYLLKDEFEDINWAQVTKACAVYFDNKYIISLPTKGSDVNDIVWVYYPSQQAWTIVTGWNVSCWATFKVGGEERLYAGKSTADGVIYRAFYGATDDGTAIEFIEQSRSFDMGQPIKKKVGGELKVVAKPSGNYTISVYGSFDNGDFNLLGTMSVSSNAIALDDAGLVTVTFPVTFYPDSKCYKKFHLDAYESWYTFEYKLYHNAVTTSSDDITIYETSITTHLEEYISEEEV